MNPFSSARPSTRLAAPAIIASILSLLLVTSPLAAQADDGPVFLIDSSVGSIFDSNVDHRTDPSSIYGVGGRMRFRVATSERRPLLALSYAPAFRTSSRPWRGDGPGYDMNAVLSVPLGGSLRLNVLGAKSRGGIDDDLNPTDQVMARVSTDLDLGGTRLRTYVARRWRQLGPAETPAIGQYVAADLVQELTRSTELIAKWRYERLQPEDTTRQWARLSAEVGLAQEIGDRLSLGLEARRRWRDHPHRVVDEDVEPVVYREDLDWRFGGALAWSPWETSEVELEYEFDRRDSTDEDRSYRGHWFGITIHYRLVTFGGRR